MTNFRKCDIDRIVARLIEVRTLLSTYKNAYYRAIDTDREPSARIYSWIDFYNDAKDDHPEAWAQYCAAEGYTVDSDAFDVLA